MSIVGTLTGEAQALRRGGRGRILLAIALPWGTIVGVRMALPVLLPYIQSEFHLSLSVAGLLVTTLWFFTAVGQLPAGILTDRYNEGLLMSTSLVLVGLALAWITLTASPLALFVAVGLWGLGHSLFPIARITMLAEVYPDRLGSALGVTMAIQDLGQTVVPPIAGVLALVLVWQLGLGFVLPMLVLGAVGIWLAVPKSTRNGGSGGGFTAETARAIITEIRRPTMVFMTFILFLFIFLWQAFTAFYPTYLVVEKGVSATVASVLFGLFFAAGAVVKPLSGMAYDRIGMRWSLVLVLVGPVGALLVLPVVENLLLLVGVTLVVSTMLGTGAITQSFLANLFAPDVQGTGLGAVRTTAAVLGSAGPVLFGVVADRGFFDEGYVVLAVLLGVVVLLTLRMPIDADGR